MKLAQQLILILAIALYAVGCAKSNSQGNNNNVTPAIPPAIGIDPTVPGTGGGTITPVFNGGSTSDFTPVSLSTMTEYVATHPLNNPQNFKININLAQVGSSRYGGQVTISYVDNGITYNGIFKSGTGTNQTFKGMYDNGRLESDYNYWFQFENQLVFTAFFEDQYGAITIALVPQNPTSTSGNDAEPIATTPYKGYVYFKNFATTFEPHSPYRACWFTYIGPYDCRSNVVQTKCGLNPGAEAGYKLLGTFNAVNVKTAFNIN